ncbi:TadE/TadG family type IV pilus assembly protein [Devosia aurantiaca]|uniref:Putative Flp pilus-assembly TadG-like N-terminal domain-containing protein n=1 Tax=Devosia aurantiaca TaxID=2714858 RepID=A0A6M1SWZ0_9HYPH|nr:hypothetical protein [Devosia aurantiaca]
MSQFTKLLRRFGRDERGVFAVIFGLMAIVLIALGGAVVDYVSLEQTRARAQTALDAAALALQRDIEKVGVTKSPSASERKTSSRSGSATAACRSRSTGSRSSRKAVGCFWEASLSSPPLSSASLASTS